MVLDITPPKATAQPLIDYINNTDEDFKILYRGNSFILDTKKLNQQVLNLIGMKYGYLSAFCSILPFKKYIKGNGYHCSEYFIKLYQEQGYFLNYDSDDITPIEAFSLFKDGKL